MKYVSVDFMLLMILIALFSGFCVSMIALRRMRERSDALEDALTLLNLIRADKYLFAGCVPSRMRRQIADFCDAHRGGRA